jgi:hypothetical protein
MVAEPSVKEVCVVDRLDGHANLTNDSDTFVIAGFRRRWAQAVVLIFTFP